MEELLAVFDSTAYEAPDGTFVAGYTAEGHNVVGTPEANCPLARGLTYRFFGRWEEHPTRGRRFRFDSYAVHEPHSEDAVVRYLSEYAPGVGVVRARQLWQLYGSEAVATLRTQPATVATATGWADDLCANAAAVLWQLADAERTTIDVLEVLRGHHFPRTVVRDVIARFGARAAAVLRRDPFRLLTASIAGCGFNRCDALYKSLNLPTRRLKRQFLAGHSALEQDRDGSTYQSVVRFLDGIRARVDGAVRPAQAARLGRRAGWIETVRDASAVAWVGTTRRVRNERHLAANLLRLRSSPARWPAVDDPRLSDHQRTTVAAALASPLAVLVGPPGTGKTRCAAAVAAALIARDGSGRVAACAPTGRAAVRLTHALRQFGVPLVAETVHRTLGVAGTAYSFRYGARERLPARYLIVDEPSMLDTDLANALFSALPDGGHVLLVGDSAQLAPVGHGAPLRDIVRAFGAAELTEFHRNDDKIVTTCAAIRAGKPLPSGLTEPSSNLRFIPVRDPERAVQLLCDAIPRIRGRYPGVQQTQVITPLNERSPVARKPLNRRLQALLNPTGRTVPGAAFRVGDKIICLRNGFCRSASLTHSGEYRGDGGLRGAGRAFVANGEIGTVLDVTTAYCVAGFSDPDRTVFVYASASPTADAPGDDPDFDLAYAVSGHKSQGSEWPVTFVMADDNPAADRVCSREWWNTVLSRATDRCFVIGRVETVLRQIRHSSLDARKTFLAERLTLEVQ